MTKHCETGPKQRRETTILTERALWKVVEPVRTYEDPAHMHGKVL